MSLYFLLWICQNGFRKEVEMTNTEKEFLAQVALGWFRVDQQGRIWRLYRFVGGGRPRLVKIRCRRAERSMSKKGGYRRVMFKAAGRRMTVGGHRIVWMVANHQIIPTVMETNHKDGVKKNNDPGNLELLTRKENVKHAIRILGRKPKEQQGELNSSAMVTEKQVMEIRALWSSGEMSQKEIGKRFGIVQATVSAIVTRKSWKHLA